VSFQPAVHLDDLPDVGAVQVVLDGQPVSVVRAEDGSLHAIDDTCSHAEVSLSEGEVDGCTIECWLHGSRFDLRTGQPTGLPATQPVAVYAVRVVDDVVHVDLDARPDDLNDDLTDDLTDASDELSDLPRSTSATTSKEH
jgi:3-phenylpropionate/trans-cinnamate dioxygenase ferredoxin subunit